MKLIFVRVKIFTAKNFLSYSSTSTLPLVTNSRMITTLALYFVESLATTCPTIVLVTEWIIWLYNLFVLVASAYYSN